MYIGKSIVYIEFRTISAFRHGAWNRPPSDKGEPLCVCVCAYACARTIARGFYYAAKVSNV